MTFRVFPCAGKVPLIRNWQTEASAEPEKHAMWTNMFGARLTHWAIPTGKINDLLVLDVDVKGNGYDTIKNLDIPDTMSQRTPSGGIHYLFKYPNDGLAYGNRTKFLGGLDARGEGGYICHYGVDKKAINLAPAWFTNSYHQAPTQPTASSLQPLKVSPEIAGITIQRAFDNIRNAAEGERNHTLNVESFKIGQLVTSQSITYEYAFEALMRAATDLGLPAFEAKATIVSGLSGGFKHPLQDPFGPPTITLEIPSPTGPDWTPAQTTREELFDETHLKKPQLFKDWSTCDIHLTAADGGTGKTTLKLFEAVCLALGERFLGFNCESPGRTLFITGEDTDKKIKSMLGKILRAMGYAENPIYNEKVETVLSSIFVKKDIDLCLIVKEPGTGFIKPNPVAMVQVMQAVEKIRPKMIVFDPISSFWGSEAALNDMAKAVSKFMSELVERSGASVEMVNHLGKQSSSQKDMSQFAGRGGSGLPSHARVVRTLRQISDKEYAELAGEALPEKHSAMECNISKFSDGSPFYNKPFLIVRDGFIFSRKNMTDAKARESEEKLSDLKRVFQFVEECRQGNKFPSRAVITAFFIANGNPIPKSRTERAIDLLRFQGDGVGNWLKQVENPDESDGGKVYIITDGQGREG